METLTSQSLPDVSNKVELEWDSLPLEFAGMGSVEQWVRIPLRSSEVMVPARLDIGVDLINSGARGIHMSRLYLLAQRELSEQAFDQETLRRLLSESLRSHQGLSSKAELRLTFALPLLRPSLVSELRGQRLYDCCLEAVYTQDQGLQVRQQVKVLYSSTCPASAALAREKLVQNLRQQFGTGSSDKVDLAVLEEWLRGGGMASVTPHAQRSLATVIVQASEGKILAWEDFLDLIETTLQTPVQTAVKRADELEFAVRNGQNLMFCEDAARRLGTVLSALNTVNGFLIKVEHFESLHPHNAVAVCRGPGDLNFL